NRRVIGAIVVVVHLVGRSGMEPVTGDQGGAAHLAGGSAGPVPVGADIDQARGRIEEEVVSIIDPLREGEAPKLPLVTIVERIAIMKLRHGCIFPAVSIEVLSAAGPDPADDLKRERSKGSPGMARLSRQLFVFGGGAIDDGGAFPKGIVDAGQEVGASL